MIETIIYTYLKNNLTVPVYMENPEDNTLDSFVLIEKTSSSKTDHIITSTLAVQSYADTLFDAATLNETVISVMEQAIAIASVSEVVLNSDYNYTDQRKKKYRYQAVFNITHY